MDQLVVSKSPGGMSVELSLQLPEELIMEQCIKRPPEKVLTMPSTTQSAVRNASQSSKKPARGRTSLLSIISAGTESKAHNPSQDKTEEPGSVTQPTANTTAKSDLQLSTENKLAVPTTGQGVKKSPPSTLAKPSKSKGKPPPTAAKPSRDRLSQISSSGSSVVTSPTSCPVTPTSCPVTPTSCPVTSTNSVVTPTSCPVTTVTIPTNSVVTPTSCPVTTVTIPTNSVVTPTNIEPKSGADSLVEHLKTDTVEYFIPDETELSTEPVTTTLPPITLPLDSPPDVVATETSSAPDSVDQPISISSAETVGNAAPKHPEFYPTVSSVGFAAPEPVTPEIPISLESVESLPPPLYNINMDLLETVNVEDLPPPPPPDSEVDLSFPGLNSLPPPIIDSGELEEFGDDVEFPPPPEVDLTDGIASVELSDNAENAAIKEAVVKITSKYDTLKVEVGSEHPDVNETQAQLSDLSKHTDTSITKGDSVEIPSHSFSVSNSVSQPTTQAVGSVHSVKQKPLLHELQLKLESKIGVGEEKTPSISSPLSELSQADTYSDETMSTVEEDAQDSITSPSAQPLPVISEDRHGENEISNKEGDNTVPTVVEVKDQGDAMLLSTESSAIPTPATSSSVSPAAHSPPLNTSSESGDSGIETGIYTLVGETVPVKLRSTLNDNRKADKSVPLFDRNSTELRRVTFRENSDAITPASTISYRSEAEKAQIKRTGLTDDERSQAELFYKGHKTEVMVCPCLGTLYFTKSTSSNVPVDDWKPEHIGIPVLIYNTGDGKRSRGLTLVLAEKGTGFLLWKTVINYESRWEVVKPVFHRLRIPGTADQLAGLAYQDEESAESFYNYFKLCTSDPEKNVLNNPNIKIKKKKEKKKSVKHQVFSLPTKSAISKPCQFTHVTKLKQSEEGILALAMIPTEEEGSEDGTSN